MSRLRCPGSFALVVVLATAGSTWGSAITAIAVAPKTGRIVAASDAGLVLFDPSGSKVERRLASKLDHLHDLAFSPDGKTLVVAGGTPAEVGQIELWQWPRLERIAVLDVADDVCYKAVWLTSKLLITACADRRIKLWHIPKRQCSDVLTGHSGPVTSLARLPNRPWFCSGAADGTIRVWLLGKAKELVSLTNHTDRVNDLAACPAERNPSLPHLASASDDGTVRVWQPTIGRMVRIVRLGTAVTAVAWNADGSRILAGGSDGKLRIIDGYSDAILRTIPITTGRIVCLAFDAPRRRLIAGDARGNVHVVKFAEKPRGGR